MAMTQQDIERIISTGLPGATVQVTDLRGDGEHYAVVVTSASFSGKSRIEQHRMVQHTFAGGLGTQLHALQIHTKIPD